jgi:hypothetical protein
MFVTRLKGPGDEEELIDPSWSQIHSAILRLDGDTLPLLGLDAGKEAPHMSTGGGKSGRYVCYITFDNQQFYSLVQEAQPNTIIRLIVGGQEGDYSAEQCVDLAYVLQAARLFADAGQLDRSLKWSVS